MTNVRPLISIEVCPSIVDLFDAYRVFYHQTSDPDAAYVFLKERLDRKESIILVAFEGDDAVGFTQLYPSFSSVSMKALYILNDLYVTDAHRGKGIGRALLEEAEAMGKALNWKGMVLETANDNPAQRLYERLGWSHDDAFKHYGKYF